jgi:putative heme iron utilization protein
MHFPSEQQLLLLRLVEIQRVASLATINAFQKAMVSMVPFALLPDRARLVVHVSGLAAHTANMHVHPDVAVMIMQAEKVEHSVHDLPRLMLQAKAIFLEPESEDWCVARTAYLMRFPEAEPMMRLDDFQFVALDLEDIRFIAGFGAARSIPLEVFNTCV